MNAAVEMVHPQPGQNPRYAQVVQMSKKSDWQIERDLIHGRDFDFTRKFLPDALSRVDRLVIEMEERSLRMVDLVSRE